MFSNTKLHQKIYFVVLYIIYFIYFITFTNIFNINPMYLQLFETINIYFISFYLVYRFNPLREVKFNKFDKQIIFSSGMFLLFSNTFMAFVKTYLFEKTKKLI